MRSAFSYPSVYIVIAPVAGGEKYSASAVSEGCRHTLVEYLTGYMLGLVAIVVLEIINAPLGKSLGVLKFVLKAAGVTCTGVRACTGINTELKSL